MLVSYHLSQRVIRFVIFFFFSFFFGFFTLSASREEGGGRGFFLCCVLKQAELSQGQSSQGQAQDHHPRQRQTVEYVCMYCTGMYVLCRYWQC